MEILCSQLNGELKSYIPVELVVVVANIVVVVVVVVASIVVVVVELKKSKCKINKCRMSREVDWTRGNSSMTAH